ERDARLLQPGRGDLQSHIGRRGRCDGKRDRGGRFGAHVERQRVGRWRPIGLNLVMTGRHVDECRGTAWICRLSGDLLIVGSAQDQLNAGDPLAAGILSDGMNGRRGGRGYGEARSESYGHGPRGKECRHRISFTGIPMRCSPRLRADTGSGNFGYAAARGNRGSYATAGGPQLGGKTTTTTLCASAGARLGSCRRYVTMTGAGIATLGLGPLSLPTPNAAQIEQDSSWSAPTCRWLAATDTRIANASVVTTRTRRLTARLNESRPGWIRRGDDRLRDSPCRVPKRIMRR